MAEETILLVGEWYRDHFAVVEAHDPPGMVPMKKALMKVGRVRVRRVFPGHILMLKILVQHLHTSKLAIETILSVGEWYRDHVAVVEAHDPHGMVPMMKSTNDG